MADRTVKVTLIAQASGYVAGMEQASKKTRELGSEAEKLAQKKESFDRLGRAAIGFGVATTAAVGLAIKAAVDWQSAWTGVLKTVDGTSDTLDRLEGDLRDLTGVLPASHAEIAAVAEAAGQLGVRTEDVAAFTKVMIDLGETTNLTSDEAATSLAQFMNIMQTAPQDVDRLGAAVVALGNDGASTERDIVQMSQRIAGAANIIGLTEGETLGLANALASVGIEAEAGGSSVSNIMIDIANAVSENGEKLQEWAAVAGVSADEFAAKFSSKPAEALTLVVEGMGRLNESGGDVFGTLQALGQTDIRVTRSLLNLAGAGDLLRQSLDLGNEAWEDNTALLTEAEKRYQTTEAQLQILSNKVNDAAINFGTVFLPVVNDVAAALGGLSDFLGGLPEPVQGVIGTFTLAAGGLALFGGAALLAVPKIAQFKAAMETLNVPIGKVGRGLGAIAGGTAAFAVLGLLSNIGRKAALGLEEIADVIDERGLDAVFEGMTADVTDLDTALELMLGGSLNANMERFGHTVNEFLGGNFSDQVADTEELFAKLDENLARLVSSGDASDAASQFQDIAAAAAEQGISVERLLEIFPHYREALAGTDEAGRGNVLVLGDLGREAQQTRDDIDRLAEAITNFNEQQFRADDATYDFKQSLLDLNDAMGAEGFTGTLDLNTQEGIDNHQMLTGIAERANAAAAEVLILTGSQEEANAVLDEARGNLERVGEAFGLSGDALQGFIDKYLASPKEITYQAEVLGLTEMQVQLDQFVLTNDGRNIRFNSTFNGRPTGLTPVSDWGFAFGGYTGAGSKYQVAGVVHRDEFVSTAETLSKPANREALEYMHAGGDIARWLPAPQYMASPNLQGSGGVPSFNVIVQSKGGVDLLQYVDVLIEQNAMNSTIDAWAGDG